MSGAPTHDLVNGVVVPLTTAQITAYQAQWAANPVNLTPPAPVPTIQQLQATIASLQSAITQLQSLPAITAAISSASQIPTQVTPL